MIRRPPRSTLDRSSAASDVYKRQNQQHAHLAPDVAADPWYRFVSRPGPYLAFAIGHVALFFGGAFWLFGWAGVAALWLTLVAIFNLGDAIDSVAHIVGARPY